MGDRSAPGAVQVVTEPDYEAMVIGAHPDDDDFGVTIQGSFLLIDSEYPSSLLRPAGTRVYTDRGHRSRLY